MFYLSSLRYTIMSMIIVCGSGNEHRYLAMINRPNFLAIVLALFHLLIVTPAYSVSAQADSSAVILMYHNVADDTHPSTSVSPEMFKKHLQYIADNGYTVWPLWKTLTSLATGKPIPDKTVVLTFDDAYKSVYSEVLPLLKGRGWPFTVFVTSKYITAGYSNYMSWDQLREIRHSGGDIGNHSLSHPRLVRQRSTENESQWRERISNEIHQAQNILRQQVTSPILVVAYPYGEYSSQIKTILRESGYFGLGQHSGAVSYVSDFQAVPRFPMATGFDGLDDFAVKIASKNLPVTVLSPAQNIVSADTDIPVLSLRLEAGNYNQAALTCYASGQGRIRINWIDKAKGLLKVKANTAIKAGRTKYNCTAPSRTEAGVFYWFSILWMKFEADGRWYVE